MSILSSRTSGVARGAVRKRLHAGMLLAMAVAAPTLASQPASAADCQSSPYPKVDWSDCNKGMLVLSGGDLSGANLAGTDFSSTDLRNANLEGANLEKATLVRASLAGAKADKANFAHLEAYRTNFAGISAQGASFAGAEVQRADFSEANLTGADFQKAELGRVNFAKATLTGTSFPMANLSRAEMRGAIFEGPIDFTDAFLFLTRLEGLDLSKAKGLEQAQIDLACGNAKTKLPAALKAPASWPCKFESD
jgi:uncharacterized protein YjbI with pentapeptide repeats